MLALGLAGGSSRVDLEDDCRFRECLLGKAPLMAASKNSRSVRLRNMCVGMLRVVVCRCGFRNEQIALSGRASAKTVGVER